MRRRMGRTVGSATCGLRPRMLGFVSSVPQVQWHARKVAPRSKDLRDPCHSPASTVLPDIEQLLVARSRHPPSRGAYHAIIQPYSTIASLVDDVLRDRAGDYGFRLNRRWSDAMPKRLAPSSASRRPWRQFRDDRASRPLRRRDRAPQRLRRCARAHDSRLYLHPFP